MVGLDALAVSGGAPRDQEHGADSRRGERRRQQRQQEVARAGEDADREADAEDDQRERIDRRIQKAEVELALGDRLARHPEPTKDPSAHADARERAARDNHPSAELRPRRVRTDPDPAWVSAEQVLRIDDRAPRGHVSDFGEHLEPERAQHPFPAHVLEAAQRLLEVRDELDEQVAEEEPPEQLDRALLKVASRRAQGAAGVS